MSRLSLRARIFLLLLAFGILIFGVWLYTNPRYTVTKVTVSIAGGPETVPQQAQVLLSSQVGVQLLRLKRKALLADLLAVGPIAAAELKRGLPNTLHAHLGLIDSPVVVSAEGGFYLIEDEQLIAIDNSDAASYQQQIPTVEIPLSYAVLMQRWGIDQLFKQVIDLAASLDDGSSLITRIKYDN
ncbi:MAG TPA: hypothetical protein VFC80_07710, partial [Sphaerochaeta sp.]|nr:hypothetical protein [Sphaerochaeta sp.]